MKCENAQQNIILAQYGELDDELQLGLEQHLHARTASGSGMRCWRCRKSWR
jgi:hypothetical protein